MTDNIPLDVVRDMGVDIAIVVDIGTPLRNRKQLATVVDVLNQSITLMTRRNLRSNWPACTATTSWCSRHWRASASPTSVAPRT